MNRKIYVGNLPYKTTEQDLESLFVSFGNITYKKIVRDHATKRSKGFGFVEFEQENSANSALSMNGREFNGRALKVSIARERDQAADAAQ